MNESQKINNNNSIDVFKFIMAFSVVAIHTEPLVNCKNEGVLTLYELIVRMAVPFFFLSSGYLLVLKIHTNNATRVVSNHLKKMIKMYVVWSVIYLPLAIERYRLTGTSFGKAVLSYIKGLVFVGEHYNSWHLWYLLSTIYALLFLWVLFRLQFKTKRFLLISIVASVISVGMDELVQYSGDLPTAMNQLKNIIMSTTANGRILQGLVYIPAGMFLAERKVELKTCMSIFAVSFMENYIISNSIASWYLLALASVAFFCMILHIKLKAHKMYPKIRSLSTYIYLIHMYVWTVYYLIVYGEKKFGVDSFVVTMMVSLATGIGYLVSKKKD